MKVSAIVCEFDPLHRGHEYLISEARRAGAECVLCVMSGAFCQRGEPSTYPKSTRARAALAAGADIVLELPFPYCCASAEYFASGAIGVIAAVGGVDTLFFGCECADERELITAAERTEGEEFREAYSRLSHRRPELGAAALFDACYRELYGESELFSGANNILAIEYIKAARRLSLDIKFHAVRRVGAGHRDMSEDTPFVSASLIREKLRAGDRDVGRYLAKSARDIILSENTPPPSLAHAERAVLAHFRLSPAASESAELSGGLGNRMAEAACRARTLEELLSLSKTKKYTDARLRRAIVLSMCGVEDADLHASPAYTTLLALSEHGAAFLSERKKHIAIHVVSNPSALGTLPESAQRAYTLARRAEGLRALCLESVTPLEDALRIPPVIK